MKSWIEQPRTINSYNMVDIQIQMDETYETVDHIEGLKTSLFPHQKPIVKAMMDLEMKRTCSVQNSNNETYKITTSAGILSESVGSGKTIDILSLILMQKHPKVIPDIANISMYDGNGNSTKNKSYYTSIVRRRFKNILNPTIIFAGVSVINQWVNAIKTFTSLKYFVVFDVRDLQKLIDIMVNKQVNQYDIVVVKNGKITRPIIFPADIIVEKKNEHSITYIYNILTNMRNYCWARGVIDDVDTIHLPHNAGIVNCLFTWYISSTRKFMSNKIITNSQFKTTSDMLMYSNYSCSSVMNNQVLFQCLNIRNNPEFVATTNKISSPKFFAYVFENLNNNYMDLLGIMGNSEANEIMEMLNGDAVDTAAERLGIKTTKVADIFELMLGKQYTNYKKSISVLEFIKEVEPMQGNRTPMIENPDPEDTYKKSDLFIKREIEYNYPNLKSLLDTTKEEYSEIKKNSSFAIERVKSNIKGGECPICSSDLEDDDIVIVKCCGTILCGMCCFSVVFPKSKQNGQCSNCRAKLNFSNLIYLNSEFDLSKIVEENLEEPEPAENDETKETDEPSGPRTKNMAILEIIKGIESKERKCVDINISNLMRGTHILPDMSYNKVLIFANYEETIANIKTMLDAEKINYWKLGGTHKEINSIVELFTNCKKMCVLIINSTKHCAGLNLQSATDLIFAHKIIDVNVETQVIGRGQRIGRTSSLRVHYIMYQNEYDWMVRNATIREIA